MLTGLACAMFRYVLAGPCVHYRVAIDQPLRGVMIHENLSHALQAGLLGDVAGV